MTDVTAFRKPMSRVARSVRQDARVRVAIRTLGEVMVTAGSLVLLFLVWQLWWTDVQANAESEEILTATRDYFDRQGTSTDAASEPGPAPDAGGGPGEPAAQPGDPAYMGVGQVVAIVHLPTIGEVRAVKDSVDLSVLNQGVLGHYADSQGPGEVGNFALAGHRTTYGRPLWAIAELRDGDPIVVETAEAYYTYRVERTRIVTPDQTEVTAPVPGRAGAEPTQRSMVLTACHPKFSAEQRIVAFAQMDDERPRGQGPPAAIGGR